MTQKLSSEKLMAILLQSIDPGKIAEVGVRQTVEVLLNLAEQPNSKVKQLEEENQKLRDENNRIKGELGKLDIQASKKRRNKDHSSEKERKTQKEHSKTSKKETIKVDREEIVLYSME